jgi:threonine dehydratase
LFGDTAWAVKQVGEETLRLVPRAGGRHGAGRHRTIFVAGIKDVFEDTRTMLEPAGALAVAGAKAWVEKHSLRGRTLVAVRCGANMNFDRLRFVAERAEVGEHREAILAVTIPEQPGSFKRFCALIGKRNVTEFNYRYADASARRCSSGCPSTIATETRKLVRHLQRHGLATRDFSDNEMAKLHIRHMVGGHPRACKMKWCTDSSSRSARAR